MIDQLGQVMVYVNDQEQAKHFWVEKMGFTVLSDVSNGLRIITLAPSDEGQTAIVLHNKKMIQEMQSELNLGTPSLMFFAKNIDALYEKLKAQDVTLGELVDTPYGKVFNFADNEDNYFAVTEKL